MRIYCPKCNSIVDTEADPAHIGNEPEFAFCLNPNCKWVINLKYDSYNLIEEASLQVGTSVKVKQLHQEKNTYITTTPSQKKNLLDAFRNQCLLCEKKGVFLSISANGLCDSCNQVVVMDVLQKGRIIQDCIKLIAKSKKMDIRLARCDLLVEHAKSLLRYEQKGIPTINPWPSQLLSKYGDMHDTIILECVTADVEKILTKVKAATTPNTKINETTKALLKINEGKKELQNPSTLDVLETRVRCVSYEAQLEAYLEAARKAEFKGQKKKALDQYQEALYFLRNKVSNAEIQAEKIDEIEAKISRLSN